MMRYDRGPFGPIEPTLIEIVITAEERSREVAADAIKYILWSGLLQYNNLPLNFYAKIETIAERYRRSLIDENAQDIAQSIMNVYTDTTPVRRQST